MRKEVTSPNQSPKPRRIPPRADREMRSRLREIDVVDAELSADFYEGMHGRIMARVEKTEIARQEDPSTTRRASSATGFSLVSIKF